MRLGSVPRNSVLKLSKEIYIVVKPQLLEESTNQSALFAPRLGIVKVIDSDLEVKLLSTPYKLGLYFIAHPDKLLGKHERPLSAIPTYSVIRVGDRMGLAVEQSLSVFFPDQNETKTYPNDIKAILLGTPMKIACIFAWERIQKQTNKPPTTVVPSQVRAV